MGFVCGCVLTSNAQRIDLDMSGRNTAEVTAKDFTSWMLPELKRLTVESRQFGKVKVSVINASTGGSVRPGWYKGKIMASRLINDGIHVVDVGKGMRAITVTLSGLDKGKHTLQAYHNNPDGVQELGQITVKVNGKTKAVVTQTSRAEGVAVSAKSYVIFKGTSAKITFSSPTDFYINSLEVDVPDANSMSSTPWPADNDLHADADGGTMEVRWQVAAHGADSQVLCYGTSKSDVEQGRGTCVRLDGKASRCRLTDLSPLKTYYWRVDAIKKGETNKGNVWTFRPRRLAFPGAEGYGRYAIGGRGGQVYHVTNLKDDGSYGSFRYGATQLSGPRTIVFDVGGIITLNSRLTINDPYVTIAGQTAPGRGIMFCHKALGVASDGITRFIRLRLGGGDSWSGSGANASTMDGIGMAGNNHSIMDHCSIGWAIDEGFSSRNARNITLQHTLISEELNYAGHSHYVEASNRYVEHGYAATIGGGVPDGVGSYHHNLLAHNNGRNWSMGGGLVDGKYAGHQDLFNNVCYNWGSRTTDGGAHEVNFVNNYYKMGPSSTELHLLTADLEGTGGGSQSYYVSGNIRENLDHSKTTDQTVLRRQRLTHGQVVDWEVFRNEPFFPSQAVVESAEAAYRNVLSDVGCNQPELDNHDIRMVNETLAGTTSTMGFYTKKKGLIDRESDSEGFAGLNIETASRPADWDTDQDGMPDWWENAYGTNASSADNNGDLDNDYYTNLEEYLNWMADPHFTISGQTSIDLSSYFRGYKSPTYTVKSVATGATATISGTKLVVNPASASTLFVVTVQASESGISLTRTFNFYINGKSAGDSQSSTTLVPEK
ncbi:MAG: hypothetical protein I3J02_07880 [Prevotella sp.]|nr:hypothetical protein [Prevotella sp.]